MSLLPPSIFGSIEATTTLTQGGKADVVGEGTASCTSRATAVRVQASRERLAEITSGRAISQQGLAATCKDSPAGRQAEGGERDLVWRMSPYERRRRGNALRDGAGHRLGAGNTVAERRGSRHLAVPGPCPGTEPGLDGSRRRDEPESKLPAQGVYVGQHLSFGVGRKALGGKPRSEPDSGNPTVRDRRGACGNVAKGAGTGCSAKAGVQRSHYGRVGPAATLYHRTLRCARRSSIPTPPTLFRACPCLNRAGGGSAGGACPADPQAKPALQNRISEDL